MARLSEAPQALEAWGEARALELSQLEALRSGDRTRPEETPMGSFDPLRPRVPQMCCPREENLRRFYRGLKAFSTPSPHTGLLPGLNSTVVIRRSRVAEIPMLHRRGSCRWVGVGEPVKAV